MGVRGRGRGAAVGVCGPWLGCCLCRLAVGARARDVSGVQMTYGTHPHPHRSRRVHRARYDGRAALSEVRRGFWLCFGIVLGGALVLLGA